MIMQVKKINQRKCKMLEKDFAVFKDLIEASFLLVCENGPDGLVTDRPCGSIPLRENGQKASFFSLEQMSFRL